MLLNIIFLLLFFSKGLLDSFESLFKVFLAAENPLKNEMNTA
jgi:hypothetical protein